MATPPKKPSVKRKPSAKKKPSSKTKKKKGWPLSLKIGVAGLALVLLSPFYYGYVLKAFTSTWGWLGDLGGNPHYRAYKSFHINIPDKYAIHGIDVSYAQGKIDWQKVRAMSEDSVHISFAFIKATEGVASIDPYFQRNWREAAKAGIICGAYHYFKPSKNGKWQARLFMQTVKVERGDLPMVVDVEELNRVSPDKMRQELKDYLSTIEKKTGVRPIIYTVISFYRDYLRGYFDDYSYWMANYHQPELNMKDKIHWLFWQHSDEATVSGIYHTVDFDAFNGDSAAFRGLLIK